MGYVKAIREKDINAFIDSIEVVINSEKEVSLKHKQFIEEFIYEFSKYIKEDCAHVFIRDLEGMAEKKPIHISSNLSEKSFKSLES